METSENRMYVNQLSRMALRCVAVLLGAGVILAPQPVMAQTVLLAANLTRGGQTPVPGVVVLPFVGETGTSGWATITVDMAARTLSYAVTVVNPPSEATARLSVFATGTVTPLVIDLTRPTPISIVLNN